VGGGLVASNSLNRTKFLNTVAERAGAHRRDVEHVWEHALAVIQESVRSGADVSITGFGKFKQRVTKARKAGMQKNPFTGEMVKVAAKPPSKKPAFTPAKPFKEFVAGGKGGVKVNTRPMALGATAAPAKKAAAAPKKAAAKKPAAKKTAAKKPAAKKGAKRR
jgi:DNA-binding protein HU-beta